MQIKKLHKPSPAFVIALLALFVALAGTAGAVTSVVPLATRALNADNAKKLNGQTAAGIAQRPGPASSAAGLLAQKSVSDSVGAKSMKHVVASCDGGKKVVAAGWSADGEVLDLGNHPTGDSSWDYEFLNIGDGGSNVSVYVVCLA